MIALDESTGEQRWALSTEVPNLTLRGDSTPTAIGGGVFWGTANGRLAAAIVERGQLIWQQPVGTPKGATEIDRLVDVDSSPVVLGGTLSPSVITVSLLLSTCAAQTQFGSATTHRRTISRQMVAVFS